MEEIRVFGSVSVMISDPELDTSWFGIGEDYSRLE
jgi:hypothetical protein